jgi:hypothetical protein
MIIPISWKPFQYFMNPWHSGFQSVAVDITINTYVCMYIHTDRHFNPISDIFIVGADVPRGIVEWYHVVSYISLMFCSLNPPVFVDEIVTSIHVFHGFQFFVV